MSLKDATRRAVELAEAGKWDEALAHLQVLENSATEPAEKAEHLLSQVDCLTQLGRLAEARTRFDQAAQLMPSTQQVRQELSFCEVDLLIAEQRLETALKNLERLQKDYLSYSQVAEYEAIWQAIEIRRGLVLAALSRFTDALPILEAALCYDKVEKDGEFQYSLARCYCERKDFEKAKRVLVEGFECGYEGETEAQAHFLLGQVHYSLGAYARALFEFEACESQVAHLGISRKDFFNWLEFSCTALNLPDRAKRYKDLGNA